MEENRPGLTAGLLYFYIHLITELISFYVLGSFKGSPPVLWILVFGYDMLAFVPQGLIGAFADRHRDKDLTVYGLALLGASCVLQKYTGMRWILLVVLCLGNALVHIGGAEVTLHSSEGKLAPAAVFVSGGSFGVTAGKLLCRTGAPLFLLLVLVISAVPASLLAKRTGGKVNTEHPIRCHEPSCPKGTVMLLTVFVVIVRSIAAYGIPTAWIRTTLHTVLFYSFMGSGKALGGILSDRFGIRKVSLYSTALALPLLLFGDGIMILSLLGVMAFSMTMSVTLGLLCSVLSGSYGLAFGLTTIGLFLGAVPFSFVRLTGFPSQCIVITLLSILSFLCLWKVTPKEKGRG